MKSYKSQTPSSREHPITTHIGGARHSVRAVLGLRTSSSHGVTRPAFTPDFGSWKLGVSLVLGCWCLVLLFCPNANAQSYSIDWFTIDGGGGTSTNGQYTLSGTIGQPDAGAMSGGNYSLVGGFWAIDGVAVIQTPGSPILSITVPAANTVVVSWPFPSTGFLLQTNNNLATTNWGNFNGNIFDIGGNRNVTNKPPVGNLFFRLKIP